MTSEATRSRVGVESDAPRSADDLVASVDTGARAPSGWQRWLIPAIALVWALFQRYAK